MSDPFNYLAKILRVDSALLSDLDKKMSLISGQKQVIEKIVEKNDLLVSQALLELGLSKENSAQKIREALQGRIINLDKNLPADWQGLCQTALNLVDVKTGFFIKKERAIELLKKYPPQNIEVDEADFESVFSALRFTQTTDWMHNFFDKAYNDLKPDDFEERPIQLKVLEEKWLGVAESFLEKKYHNVSHLKELGIIFIIPLKLDTPGEILRIFTLLLHYLNEVPFYSKLFRKFSNEENFIENLKSLLRGDVLDVKNAQSLIRHNTNWLIVQRYLAKDDANDPRLFMPHVNPEAEHWLKAQQSLGKLGPDFEFWKELDFVGDFFPSTSSGQVELASFDLVDLVMTLVKKGSAKYLYHQQEALWKEIFIGYFGRERMNELIENNIIKGYIDLK